MGRRRRVTKNKMHDSIKPYVQFSKRIIAFCILNLIIIEFFVMFMVYITRDTNVLPYLITSLAVQFLGCVIWYLKNSEAEKKIRIEAEIERMKLVSKGTVNTLIKNVKGAINPEEEPDTFYKGDDCNVEVNTDILPISSNQSDFGGIDEDVDLGSESDGEDDSVG